MKTLVLLATLALLVAPVGRSEPPPQFVCTPLDSQLLGDFFRYDDPSWNLNFAADCTYSARHHATEEGAGNYTVTEHSVDAPLGVFVVSDDRGCRQPDLEDLPTPYDFAYQGGVLKLAPHEVDRCSNARGEGRPRELAGHGGWVKSVAGKLTISIDSRFFTVRGALTDKGTFRVLHSKVRKGVKAASLRLSSVNGTFTISERIAKGNVRWSLVGLGAGAYRLLEGGGTGTIHPVQARQSLHGQVSN